MLKIKNINFCIKISYNLLKASTFYKSTIFVFLFLVVALIFGSQNSFAQVSKVQDLDDSEFNVNFFDDEDFKDGLNFETEAKINQVYDPFEKVNRKIFIFNDYTDRYFLEPTAKSYRKLIPKLLRQRIRNFFTNIGLPFSVLNSILQGKVENSLANSSTFLINSTIGIGGLFDVAGYKGIRYNQEDFGQTLAVYGVSEGPYLMLPFLGPSNCRDFGGLLANKSIDPLSFNLLKIGGKYDLLYDSIRIGFTTISVIDNREGLIEIIDGVRADSFDPYTTIKSAYNQRRNNEISK